MPIHLNITADTVKEFDELYARFAPAQKRAEPIPTNKEYVPAGKAERDIPEPPELPEPVYGLAAMSVKQIKGLANGAPPEQLEEMLEEEKNGKDRVSAVKAIEEALSGGEGNDSDTSTSTESTGETESSESEDAATPPVSTEEFADIITEDMLKDALMDLLKAKSANEALKVLEESTGCRSISSGPDNILDKAKSDPGLMKKAYDALVAAAA